MKQASFRAALNALHWIDHADLPELSDDEWVKFRTNPIMYYWMDSHGRSYDHREAIWREVSRIIDPPPVGAEP